MLPSFVSPLILTDTSFLSLVIAHPCIEYNIPLIQMYSMLEKLQINAELCVIIYYHSLW